MTDNGIPAARNCSSRSQTLRVKGFAYEQIVDILALDHDLSPLRLYRYAHGMTTPQVVDAANQLDPAGTATLRDSRLRDYEAWPDSGRRPPTRILALLARIYHAHARHLVTDRTYASYTARDQDTIDHTDHRRLDPHHRTARRPEPLQPAEQPTPDASMETERVVPSPPARSDPLPSECTTLLRALDAMETNVNRRQLLFELAIAMGGTSALPLLRHLTDDEKARLAHAVRGTTRIDDRTVTMIENLTARCWRQDETLGPAAVVSVADAQRNLVAHLLSQANAGPALRDRILTAYWELCHLAGWSHYDLLDYDAAAQRYRDALDAAHELADPSFLAHIHGLLATMAVYRGQPTRALDHAYAAQGWADSSTSRRQRAATTMMRARILATTKRDETSLRLLDRAQYLAANPRNEPTPRHLFWCTPGRVHGNTVYCLVALRRPRRALQDTEQALRGIHKSSVRRRGELLIDHAQALIHEREIPTAASRLAELAHISTMHSSARLTHSLRHLRKQLHPWKTTNHIRDLDEQLTTLGLTPTP
jgi:tetratricopeptide (TPR) repeat protein